VVDAAATDRMAAFRKRFMIVSFMPVGEVRGPAFRRIIGNHV
jgi:hypothetical protein